MHNNIICPHHTSHTVQYKLFLSMSHRERVEQFNEKVGSLTELNDIPRVSAAGNG